MSKRKCLILGGCGFIGSYLAEALLDERCSVTIFDKERVDLANIAHILADILEIISQSFSIPDESYDLILCTQVPEHTKDPQKLSQKSIACSNQKEVASSRHRFAGIITRGRMITGDLPRKDWLSSLKLSANAVSTRIAIPLRLCSRNSDFSYQGRIRFLGLLTSTY